MKPRLVTRALVAIALAILITLATSWGAQIAANRGAVLVSDVLFWPNTLMQMAIPLNNIGTIERPFYEATSLNLIAYALSYFLAVFAYAICVYLALFGRRIGKTDEGRNGEF
jgi:hypothetical protein